MGKSVDHAKLVQHCEEQLRMGQSRKALAVLREISVTQIPRRHALDVANLCRRVNCFSKALKILSPIVRNAKVMNPSTKELAEYAVNLQRIGSIHEAIRILKKVNHEKEPTAILYLSFCHFNIWEYDKTVPWLNTYISAMEKGSYSQIIGMVNLAAALIEIGELTEAKELLAEVLILAKTSGFSKLGGNACELMAQIDVRLGAYQRARTHLEKGKELLSLDASTDFLFVKKWTSIVDTFISGKTDKLHEFKREALQSQHWETVRECDFYLSTFDQNKTRLNHLYFGTPFAGYKKKILDIFTGWNPPPIYRAGNSNRPLLDLQAGSFKGQSFLNHGKALHKFIALLASDLYRPMRIGYVFSELFPNENFNIESSPNRIHQLAKRARTLLDKAAIPLHLGDIKGQYRLQDLEKVCLVLKQASAVSSKLESLSDLLHIRFARTSFTAKEARGALGIALTSFNRVINLQIEKGALVKLGAGPQTKYQFLPKSKKK